jgi:hypothetical protein
LSKNAPNLTKKPYGVKYGKKEVSLKTFNFFVLAADYNKTLSNLGPESKVRCDAMIEKIKQMNKKEEGAHFQMFLTAGHYPRYRCAPLRDFMKIYIEERLYHLLKITNYSFVYTEVQAWSTYEEISLAVELLKKSKERRTFLFTSSYHMKRALKIAELITKEISFIPIEVRYLTLKRYLLEYPKYLKVYWDHFILKKNLSIV